MEQFSEPEFLAWLDSLNQDLTTDQISTMVHNGDLSDFVNDLRYEIDDDK